MCAADRLLYTYHIYTSFVGTSRDIGGKFLYPEHCRFTDNNFEKQMNIKYNAALTKFQGIKFKQSLTSKYKQHTMHDSMYN